MAGKIIQQIIGNVGKDPVDADTSVGPVTRVNVAVTRSYPSSPGVEDGTTRWVSVAVFKPSIREQIKAQVAKGTSVIAEGVITQSEYEGKPQYGMKASRFGLATWFVPSAEDKAAATARAAKTAPVEEVSEW